TSPRRTPSSPPAAAAAPPTLPPPPSFPVPRAAPPILSVTSIGHKDTYGNVRDTGEFVVNIGTESLMEQMNASSAPLAPEVDEFVATGLTPEDSDVVAAPRVAEAPVALECVRHDVIELGSSATVPGRVVSVSFAHEEHADGGR